MIKKILHVNLETIELIEDYFSDTLYDLFLVVVGIGIYAVSTETKLIDAKVLLVGVVFVFLINTGAFVSGIIRRMWSKKTKNPNI